MAKITTLYGDSAKTEALYPRTKVSAVSDGDNRSLEEIIDDLTLTGGEKITISNNAVNWDGIGRTTLWTNADSSSSFSPQLISLDLSSYSYVIVVFRILGTGSENASFICMPNGYDMIALVENMSSTNVRKRLFNAKSTGVQFYDARDNGSVSNDVMIPRFIYGIK